MFFSLTLTLFAAIPIPIPVPSTKIPKDYESLATAYPILIA